MLISSRSAIWEGPELSKCGVRWLATAVVFVEGAEGRWNWTVCTRNRTLQEHNTTNIIVMVLSENYNS